MPKERYDSLTLMIDMADIVSVCKDLIVIDKGNIVYQGLMSEGRKKSFVINLEEIIKEIYMHGNR